MYHCKFQGCDSPHDTEAGLVEHIVKTQDDDHPDDRGDAWLLVRDEWYSTDDSDPDSTDPSESDGGDGTDPAPEPPDDGGPDTTPDGASTDGDPAKSEPPADPNSSVSSEGTPVDCWDCGATNAVPPGLVDRGRFECGECGAPCEVPAEVTG